ncbi:MAG: CotH kinase family protein, partial [Pirellulaceae bacterium]|nr:CotH kinase family protein [Pirellulaceae bacterium]
KESKEDLASLVGFIKTVNEAQKGDIATTFQSKMELDDFLHVTAVMCFAGAFDQLTGWNPHNYYLYHDRERDRWRYLPWDLDVGFCEVAFGHIHVLEDWNAAWPVPPNGAPNPLLNGIVADPSLLARYREVATEILEKYFAPERLHRIIDTKYALIKKDLQKDPFPHNRVTNPDDHGYEDIVASMKIFMQKRYASARKQLDAPGPRPQPTPRQHTPPSPELEAKIRQIQQLVHLRMQRIGSLLQRGRSDEAEKLIDETTKLLRETSAAEKE